MNVNRAEVARLADEFYAKVRTQVETPENIGKMLTLDVDTGEYEIDERGIESSFRLQAKHPGARIFGIRIGYRTAATFGGNHFSPDHPCLLTFVDSGEVSVQSLAD